MTGGGMSARRAWVKPPILAGRRLGPLTRPARLDKILNDREIHISRMGWMLCLSQTTGYAILALSSIERAHGSRVLARDIARATGIPLPYLSKILQALGQSGLIRGKRGFHGGFSLARPADQISIMDVTEAVEGRRWLAPCLLGMSACNDPDHCPLHRFWGPMRQRIERELKRRTLREMARCQCQRRCGSVSISAIAEAQTDTPQAQAPAMPATRRSRSRPGLAPHVASDGTLNAPRRRVAAT